MIAPAVKQSNIFARISALLAISCMATGVGYSNPNSSASDDASGSVLTVEIAKQYLADADSVDTKQFTSIEDAAAEALGKHDGQLNLSGLTSVSDSQAEALAKHKGDLGLAGLTELSEAAAEALGKNEGEVAVDHSKLPPSASKILKDAGH